MTATAKREWEALRLPTPTDEDDGYDDRGFYFFEFDVDGATHRLVTRKRDKALGCADPECTSGTGDDKDYFWFGESTFHRGRSNAVKHYRGSAHTAKPKKAPPLLKGQTFFTIRKAPASAPAPAPATARDLVPADEQLEVQSDGEDGVFVAPAAPAASGDNTDDEIETSQLGVRARARSVTGAHRSTTPPPPRGFVVTSYAPAVKRARMDDQARQSMAERRSTLLAGTARGDQRPAAAAATSTSVATRTPAGGDFAGDYSVMLGGFEDYFEAPLSERSNAATCCGVEHEFEAPLSYNFPHDLRSVVPGLNFYYDARTDCVRSTKCELIVFGDDVSCGACIGVPNEGEYLEHAEVRARIVDLGASNISKVYLTNAQKDQGQRRFYERSERLRLALLGRDRRLATAMRKLDTYKQLMVLIATNKLSRVRELFALQLRRGASPHAMIDVFKKAASGLYRPKQYDDEQIAETVLAWRLGAHSLVYALNHSNSAGLASLSTAKRRGKIDAFYACVEDVSHGVDESLLRIRLNLEPLFKKEHVGPKILWHLKIDDVKGDKRLRVDDKDGLIKGCCFHAKHHVSLKINAFSDVVAVRDAIDEGRVHYGTELTVVAIAANRELNYEPHIVALSAGCLNGDPPERTRRIIEQAIEVWVSDLRGQATRGVLTTVQPDGAASFVKTCHAMFFCKRMTAAHPLFPQLSCLPLFPLWTGDGVYERARSCVDLELQLKMRRC